MLPRLKIVGSTQSTASFRWHPLPCPRWVRLEDHPEASLTQLRGLSRGLKSLHLYYDSLPLQEIIDVICSFPLLENLVLKCMGSGRDADQWVAPPTSPKLTGHLHLEDVVRPVVRALLDLPGGLHFTIITINCHAIEHAGMTKDLLSRCSGTLESLRIGCSHAGVSPRLPTLINTLTCSTDTDEPWTALDVDLSKAQKLEYVEFRSLGSSVQWIVNTLQTARLEPLRQITIFPHFFFTTNETVRQGWRDLDRLLVQFWASHSIVPKIKHQGSVENMVRFCLPNLAGRGGVFEVGDYWE